MEAAQLCPPSVDRIDLASTVYRRCQRCVQWARTLDRPSRSRARPACGGWACGQIVQSSWRRSAVFLKAAVGHARLGLALVLFGAMFASPLSATAAQTLVISAGSES